jgi:multicomponent Na+:H+ antiporter subunit D
MVTGVGIGTMMSLNGTVAHAFCHIIYKALLWMSAGSVLYMVGKSKCTDLGGLYKTMPWTLIFGAIGALSISSFPATSGFTSKSLIIDGAIHEHLVWVWLILEIASAGVFLHAGIKFPYFVFFAKDKGLRPGETNKPMLIAMAFLAFMCIFLGLYPQPLYNILPYEVHYQAYTFNHVIAQLQLLMLSALVFFLFLKLLKRTETISLDTDWFYRLGGRLFYSMMDTALNGINSLSDRIFVRGLAGALGRVSRTAPQLLALGALIPIWSAQSIAGKQLQNKIEKTRVALRTGASPVGISAALATIFLLIVYLLT